MSVKLFAGAILKFFLGVVIVGAIIFIPAGSLSFLRGWILMGVLFAPMFIAGIVMMIKNPALLASRLDAKEKRSKQDIVQKLSGLMFLVGFVLSGLGFRFGWYELPLWASIAAAVVFLCAYILYAEVMRENAYLSRTVKVSEGQRVIDTGMYAVVRHPMYSVTLVLFLSMPIILGSVFAFPIFLFYPLIIAMRIGDEEELLSAELDGYEEYRKKVKYRLIPFIW